MPEVSAHLFRRSHKLRNWVVDTWTRQNQKAHEREKHRARSSKKWLDPKWQRSPMCLAFYQLQALNTKARQTGRTAVTKKASLGVCLHSGTIACRAKWTRSLRTSLDDDFVERTVLELLTIDSMRRVRCDRGQFGMTSVDDDLVARHQSF